MTPSSVFTCPPRTDVAAVSPRTDNDSLLPLPLRSLFESHLLEIKRLMRVVESETFFVSTSGLAVGDPLDVACAASNFEERTLLVTVARMIVAATRHGNEVDTDRLVAAIDGGDGFCGWLTEFDAGVDLLEGLADVVAKVDWRAADGDVLKDLYHDLIDSTDRKERGEFYTPDWLAAEVVQRVLLHDPSRLDEAIETAALALDSTTALSEGDDQAYRILDPACGSGTFLFCAAKTVAERVRSTHPQLTSRIREIVAAMVTGIDINPVAVEMAKATLSAALPDGPDVPLRIFHADALHPSQSQQTTFEAAAIVTNPPWLIPNSPAAGNIKADMAALAQQYKLRPKMRSSAKTDLAAVFTARIVDLYLADNATFGLVLPGSAVTNQTWAAWRSGNWGDTTVNFEHAANIDKMEPAPFPHAPNGTSIVIGRRLKQDSDTADNTATVWNDATHVVYSGAANNPTVTAVKQFRSTPSPYATKFRRGAVASPLGLCLALDPILPITACPADIPNLPGSLTSPCSSNRATSLTSLNPQSCAASTARITTKTSTKPPWTGVGYTAVIETAALLRVLRAQTLRPFKCSPDAWMIAPLSANRQRILELDDPEFATTLPHTHTYWTIAEARYQQDRAETAGVTLSQNIDRHRTLTNQLKPGTSNQQHKVFYNKSGNTLRASRGPTTLIADDKLYWHTATTTEEALYLTGILNADSLQTAWQQTKTSKLHYDLNPLKHVPVPEYDPDSALHTQIVNTAHHIERRQTPPAALKQALNHAVTQLLPDYTT